LQKYENCSKKIEVKRREKAKQTPYNSFGLLFFYLQVKIIYNRLFKVIYRFSFFAIVILIRSSPM